jgi:hypothetical protein
MKNMYQFFGAFSKKARQKQNNFLEIQIIIIGAKCA